MCDHAKFESRPSIGNLAQMLFPQFRAASKLTTHPREDSPYYGGCFEVGLVRSSRPGRWQSWQHNLSLGVSFKPFIWLPRGSNYFSLRIASFGYPWRAGVIC